MARTITPGDGLADMSTAAQLLGITTDQAYSLARTGDFPAGAAFRVGRRWRVSLRRLEAWMHELDHNEPR